MTKDSKEYRVTFPGDEAEELDATAYQRGVRPTDIIRERCRQAMSQVSPTMPPTADRSADLVAIAPEVLGELLDARLVKFQSACLPIAEGLKPLQPLGALLHAALAQITLLQSELEGVLVILECSAMDTAAEEVKANRQALIEAVKEQVRQQAAGLRRQR